MDKTEELNKQAVPDILVTSTGSNNNSDRSSNRRTYLISQSSLSSSLPNLACTCVADDKGDKVCTCGNKTKGAFSSPKPMRKSRALYGSHGMLRIEGNSSRLRGRPRSSDSVESYGTSYSHNSTCATSDYTHLTSLDMINILAIRAAARSGSSTSMNEFGTLRRTHSNPENCMLEPGRSIRDSKSFDNLNNTTITETVIPKGMTLAPPVVVSNCASKPDLKLPPIGKSSEKKQSGPCVPSASIAISEENLVSRVTRWLSTVENPIDDINEEL